MGEHVTQLEKDIVPKCHNCMFCRPLYKINTNIPLKHQVMTYFCDLKKCRVELDALCEKWGLSWDVQKFVIEKRLESLHGELKT